MRRKDDIARRQSRDFPYLCAVPVPPGVNPDWPRRFLEIEQWCRSRVGADGFARRGRLGDAHDFLDVRFRSADIAAEFHAAFGGELGPASE